MTEQEIEQRLLVKLEELKYVYRPDIDDRATLEANFRAKFEALHQVRLTDNEFSRLLEQIISPEVFANAQHLRQRNSFTREDNSTLHYSLVHLKDWCKNSFEVVKQVRINTHSSHHRYDVLLLINGLPLVQIELKALSISPRKAMQQIVDYKNHPENGYTKTLLCFVQLFIVSNRSSTWYFANNNAEHFRFDADERFLPVYEFADRDNKKINHLDAFAESFLPKCTLAEMISRYMVLVVSERRLLMMRPYQIYAVQAIVDCIHQNRGNGYIWHTTGSGKTLTSFKAATLLKDNPDIDKCLFVVDRKDLDRQTREEFNKFQPGCVEENTNTSALVHRLLSTDYADKVLVCTIQKLGLALDSSNKRQYAQRLAVLRNKRLVFIFDECHRSQFGENHKAIKDFFPRSQLFGFTGTPIFEANASLQQIQGQEASLITTEDIFEKQLHAYTITHAIEDGNVLRFHIDYYKAEGEAVTKQAIVEAILKKHQAATHDRKFNALLATASINDAIAYYRLFQEVQARRQAEDARFQPLNIACVFSPPADDQDARQAQEDLHQEKLDNQEAPEEKKAALRSIMADYNARYNSNHDLSHFDLYYQDIQQSIKNQQYPELPGPKIDLTIVVDMLLTGFDSKYLNTLYVDKNLKYQSLIQAFSRTNRVLNYSKPYGNILDFRQQQEAVDTAIQLFSGIQAGPGKAKEIWLVDPAPVVIGKLHKAVGALQDFMASQDLPCTPEAVANIKGDEARCRFANMFKEVRRLNIQLNQYTDLSEEDAASIEQIIPREQAQGFQGVYLDLAQRLRKQQRQKDSDPNSLAQQLDLELVLFASAVIDYDYIMTLLANTQEIPARQQMTREDLIRIIQADAKFLDEREELIAYIGTLKSGEGLSEKQIRQGYEAFKAEKMDQTLAGIAQDYGLSSANLQDFVNRIMDRMIFDSEHLSELLAPLELGWKERGEKELALMQELIPLLHKLAQGQEISGLKAYEQ